MLEVIGAGVTNANKIDWHNDVWKKSPERDATYAELDRIHTEGRARPPVGAEQHSEFSTPWMHQIKTLLFRNFQMYWRDPTYLVAKGALNVTGGLFIGFTFWRANDSIQGTQNKLFSVFMSLILSVPLAGQLQIPFIDLRTIYEIRERPSRMYGWTALVTSQILVELPFNILGSSLYFLCWFWTVFGTNSGRAGYTYLMIGVLTPLYYTTIGQAVAAMSPNASIAAILFSVLFSFVITLSAFPLSIQILPNPAPQSTAAAFCSHSPSWGGGSGCGMYRLTSG
jgi:ATP-binding cassette subfamily G (WHITE) protein 2 (SNQ2)